MKTPVASALSLRCLLGIALAFAGSLRTAHADEDPPLNPQLLDQLLGPIALYPDALVALILPASTVPADIVLAQRFLTSGGDTDQIDNELWNESVKALARYPQLIQWMDENLTWTRQLGTAFLSQPDTVMESVQRLRTVAKANGNLTSTPQQKLVLDGDDIQIVPAQPDVIYVPYYNPNLVYRNPVYYDGPPYVTFGEGFSVGYWLSYDFNWRRRAIIVGDRHHNWHENRDWNRHPVAGGKPNYGNNWRPWTPPPGRPPYSRPNSNRPNRGVIQPRSYPGSLSYPAPPEHPRTVINSRPDDHNRASTPPKNPGWNRDNHTQRSPSDAASRPEPRPRLDNRSRPPEPGNPPSAGPRPERETAAPPRPAPSNNSLPVPPRSQPSRHGEPRPGVIPPPRPANPPAPPAPKPVSKDGPRDEKIEVQR